MRRRAALGLMAAASGLAAIEGTGHIVRRLLRFSGDPPDWPPQSKKPGALRILCLGESTTYGMPFGPELAWPAMLEFLLKRREPEVPLEVINAGCSGATVEELTLMYDRAGGCESDIVILMSGHNEFYRAFLDVEFVPGSSMRNGSIHRSAITLPSTIAKLPAWIRAMGSRPNEPAEALASMYPGFLEFQRKLMAQGVADRFKMGLESLVESCARRGALLLVALPPSNLLSWLPFVREPSRSNSWSGSLQKAAGELAGSRPDQAKAAIAETVLSSSEALPLFVYGIADWDLGSRYEGLEQLTSALDIDPNRIRAGPAIWRAASDAAQERSVPLADVRTDYFRALESGSLAEDIFLDHCHYTPIGAMWVAGRIVASMNEYGLVRGLPEAIFGERDINLYLTEFRSRSAISSADVLDGLHATVVINRFYEQWLLADRACGIALREDPTCGWASGTRAQLVKERPGFSAMGDLGQPIPFESIPARFG